MTLEGNDALVTSRFDNPPADPMDLLRYWLDQARQVGVAEPDALALSTVDGDGAPSSRVVLLKSLDSRGLVFSTSGLSKKGQDMAKTGLAAGLLFWRETVQQVSFAGPVRRLPDHESTAIFASRERSAQAVATVSRQSESLDDEASLRMAVESLVSSSEVIARPPHWAGYRMEPTWMEFWHGRKDRFHRRLRFDRTGTSWQHRRLQP